MSNVRAKYGSVAPHSLTSPQGPGKTYGERLKQQKFSQNISSSTPVHSDTYRKDKHTEHVEQFHANAAFKAGRGPVGAPYKPASLHYTEEGLASSGIARSKKHYSDEALGAFLNRVIEDPRLHSQRSIHKTVLEASRTKAKKRIA